MIVVSVVVGFLFISISIPVGCLINCRSRKFMVFLSSIVGVNVKFGCN